MTHDDFLRFLWDHGHFWNPKYPESLNVTEAGLAHVLSTDRVFQEAVKSFQESDANLLPISLMIHRRPPIADGLVGPATMELAETPRCPMPDHPPPPGATFTYADPELQRFVESYQEWAATGRGSWPAGCYGNPGVHEVKINYDLSKLTDKHREWWPEIRRRSHAAVAEIGIKLVEASVGQANITVYGRVLGGNIIGMAEFNNQTCGDVVFCQLNPNFAPTLESVLKLLLHENGHNWNLEHRGGGIMNPSIMPDSVPNYWVKREGGQIVSQDNSYPTLRGFFGGEPVADIPPTPPPSPPPTPIPPTPGPVSRRYAVALEIDDTGSVPVAKNVKVDRIFDWGE